VIGSAMLGEPNDCSLMRMGMKVRDTGYNKAGEDQLSRRR